MPDLNFDQGRSFKLPNIDGKARAIVGLQLPLIKNVPRDRVTITQEVILSNAAVNGILPGVDLCEGEFNIELTKDMLAVTGPAKLNGVAAKIDWRKPRSWRRSQRMQSKPR